MTTKAPAKKAVVEAETVGRADRIVNSNGQAVVATDLPDSTDVAFEDIGIYGDSRSITVVFDGSAYKLDTQAAAYLANATRSLVTNLAL